MKSSLPLLPFPASARRNATRSAHIPVALLISLLTLAGTPSVRAQVPGLITYHGVIEANGNGYNGPGHFKFALVNDGVPSLVTFWSNDGTLNGAEPASHVVVDVDHGVFSVVLGDSSLLNMADLPTTVFTNAGIHLRLWFREDNNGPFTLLTPDQRITAAGYALMSAHVAEGAIGPGQLADGSITTAKLADGAITTPKILDGAVTSAKIAPGAITSAGLADLISLRELTLENAAGQNRIELSGSGDSGTIRMNHGSIGRFLEILGTTSGGQLKLFDRLGGEGTGQTTVELGSSTLGGYARVYQDNGNAGVHLNGQNGDQPGGTVLVYRSSGLGVVLQGQANSGGGEVEVRDSASDRRVLLQGLNGTLQLYNEGSQKATWRATGDTGDLVALDRIGVAASVDAAVYQASLGHDGNGG
ncbi:MAG TPA: hypothetical protein VJS65_11985, partial [Verrucomicrobiae bacterium]|nr:hypothetical protein [Verrucomicrobiae bacterium]